MTAVESFDKPEFYSYIQILENSLEHNISWIYKSSRFFAIHKPEGFFVHPPEKSPYPVDRNLICTHLLGQELKQKVFPVHRLDSATSGVVLFAYDSESTRELSFLFSERQIEKRYLAVVRGFLPDQGEITLVLPIQGFSQLMECRTDYKTISKIELPRAIGRYPTARYSLLEIHPRTGRWHQIRRHFDRIAHPLIGDVMHGDSHHNRFFRDELKIRGLCLWAESLEFIEPWTLERISIRSEQNSKWKKIFKLFGKESLELK